MRFCIFTALFLANIIITASCGSAKQAVNPAPVADYAYTPEDHQALQRLSQAIQIPTVSYEDSLQIDYEAYETFIRFLRERYPGLHETAEVSRIGGYSLLFKWQGQQPRLKPALFLGHYDVVPVTQQARPLWTHPPFEGTIASGFVWGRGAMDDKSGIMSMVEAAEALIQQGFQPERTLYIALHHDEEIGGLGGARRVAEYLMDEGEELDFIVDEGPPLAMDVLENIEVPIALIGMGEKGSVNIELLYRQEGGHSSMPPSITVISTLSRAINRIEQRPMQAYYKGLIRETFEPLIPYLGFRQRLAFNNTWLFKGAIIKHLSRNAATNAALRTTAAKTIFEAGFKENVLPARGRVIINFRIHPNDSIEEVKQYVESTIRNPAIDVNVMERAREASPVSDTGAAPFQMLQGTIEEAFPGTLVAPSLFVAASDSRHFHELTSNVYRFRPIRATHEDRGRVHGIDERISTRNYLEMIRFQKRLIQNATEDF